MADPDGEAEPIREAPALEGARGAREHLHEEVSELRQELKLKLDDPDFGELDYSYLEDQEAELELYLTQGRKLKVQLARQEDTPDLKQEDDRRWKSFQKLIQDSKSLCKRLKAIRQVFGKIQTANTILDQLKAKHLEEPRRDYSAPVKRMSERLQDILEILDNSSVPAEHQLRTKAMELEISLEDIEIVDIVFSPADSKEDMKPRTKPGYKRAALAIPTFSGELKDWIPFWRSFKEAVHDADDLNDAAKLMYLKSAMKDKSLFRRLNRPNKGDTFYQDMVKELQTQFTKPVEMHQLHVSSLMKMEPVKLTRESINTFVENICEAVDGLKELKQTDLSYIVTSMVVSYLPQKLKQSWDEKLEGATQVPPVEDLVKFLRAKADNPSYVDKASSKPKVIKPVKQRGSVNVITPQPTPKPSSQPTHQPAPSSTSKPTPSTSSQPSHSSSYQKPRQAIQVCRYVCPLCNENHYTYACAKFEALSLSQRKEHVRSHSLCGNCLKPNHASETCRSTYNCKQCQQRHNTLLHEPLSTTTPTTPNSQPARATPPAQGTVNLVNASKPTNPKGTLIMTCQVKLTGPSGRSMIVRGLLDTGSTTSLVSTRVMKRLDLTKTGPSVYLNRVEGEANAPARPMVNVLVSSVCRQGWSQHLEASATPRVTADLPLQPASSARHLPHIKPLKLADPYFDQPGQVDLLLGEDVLPDILLPEEVKGAPGTVKAWNTVFGWALRGPFVPDKSTTSAAVPDYVATCIAEQASDELMVKFWKSEEPPAPQQILTPEEEQVEEHYQSTHSYNPQKKRYVVTLPKKQNPPQLGDSRRQALVRYKANERSLQNKGTFDAFQAVVKEYFTLGHARIVTPSELSSSASDCYYLPMHGVTKESSSTTKLRVVFDASAKTTSGYSLNDTLSVGPTLHPTLDRILLKFRTYQVAITSDISKMYREVLLSPQDQQLHRFLWRANPDDPILDYCMERVTFGVAASPYLAVKTLQQTAQDHASDYPVASYHVFSSFYVDDLLCGADTVEQAIELFEDLREVLSKGSFHLRKWRSSAPQVLQHIPDSLLEPLPQQDLVDRHSANYPKALGLAWDSVRDTMATHVDLPSKFTSTKRGIISDVARTFDVLGWLSPVLLPMKLLFQSLWEAGLGWDEEVPAELENQHRKWREELPLLSNIHLPRCYFRSEKALTVELHGFCDASEKAYSAVVYLRATYSNQPPSCRLVIAKTKVAPVKVISLPRLELCGAHLLSKILTTSRETLDLPLDSTFAWCDSTIVLAWLDGSPKRFKTYVANRITAVNALIPSNSWRHVPTLDNPADCASRGIAPSMLEPHPLWWEGPPWLSQNPIQIPSQPNQSTFDSVKEEERILKVNAAVVAAPATWFEHKFESYKKLTHVMAWVIRFAFNFLSCVRGHAPVRSKELSVPDIRAATLLLRKHSQRRSFPKEMLQLQSTPPKPISVKNNLIRLHPFLGQQGLLRVGGRLSQSSLPTSQKHPIILSSKDIYVELLLNYNHVLLGHCGPTLLLSHAGNLLHLIGGRKKARQVCRTCIVCRKAAARLETQLMGQLPPERVNPKLCFVHVGVDFAGPFMTKYGHIRKPVKVETYLAVFVCFSTKAVHLELVEDLSTPSFLAAFKNFIGRRNVPQHIYCDNGTNFLGAKNALRQLYLQLRQEETQTAIKSYLLTYEITWHNTPARGPHFGGLWEAAVKSAKYHLKRIVGPNLLSFSELYTIAVQTEACLNSRPLGAYDSHSEDGSFCITPAHFLMGRPALAYPENPLPNRASLYKRWTLCQSLMEEFWRKWSRDYLQHLQTAGKWHKKRPNLLVGDLVLMSDANSFKQQWTLARVTDVYPGRDGLVRVVDVKTCDGKTYRRPITRLSMLLTSTLEDTPDDSPVETPDGESSNITTHNRVVP